MPSLRSLLCARLSLLLLAVLFCSCGCLAQQVYDGNQNLPPFGSFTGSDFDTVVLQNGSIHIRIPVSDLKQRQGKTSAEFVFDTPDYLKVTDQNIDPQGHRTTVTVVDPSMVGWRFTTDGDSRQWSINRTVSQILCGTTPRNISGYVVVDPQGSMHPVPFTTDGCTSVTAAAGPTLDGSGMLVSVDYANGNGLTLKDGTQIKILGNREDPNGNISSTSVDNLGRALISSVNSGPPKTFTTPLGRTFNTSYTNTLRFVRDDAGLSDRLHRD